MLLGASTPPHASGVTWSTTWPGHAPRTLPVAGQGFARLNSASALRERGSAPASEAAVVSASSRLQISHVAFDAFGGALNIVKAGLVLNAGAD